jgi:predicted ABC-type transport system involved in lysophospholipase L1 biosynthesis ATPase subunit
VENNWLRRRVLEKKNPGRQKPCWGSLFCTNLTQPTGNLDSVTAGEIINILKTLAKERNKCVIVVTHSKEAADSADIILELSGKKLKKVK